MVAALGEVVPPAGLGKEIAGTFQRFVISGAERQQVGSVPGKADLWQGRCRPRTGPPATTHFPAVSDHPGGRGAR